MVAAIALSAGPASHGVTPAVAHSGTAQDVLPHAASVAGLLTAGQSAEIGAFWGTADGGTNVSQWAGYRLVGSVTGGLFQVRLTGLLPTQCYAYRFRAVNESGEAWTDRANWFATATPWVSAIAHRGGFWMQVPENTLTAFRSVKGRADYVEFDVQQCADGELVVMHDASINRTTDATGYVSNLTLAQLKSCSDGYPARFGSAFAAERIPTLTEALQAIAPDTTPLLDVKAAPDPSLYVSRIRALGMERKVIVSCTYLSFLQEIHRLAPEIPLCLTGDSSNLPALLPSLKTNGIDYVSWDSMTAAQIPSVHNQNLRAFAWTVDDPAAIRTLVQAGIDGIISNDPETVTRVAQEDLDADGLPDAWERQHAGTTNLMNRMTDSDGDGMTDSDEFYAGTNPNLTSSLLRFDRIRPLDGGNVALEWQGLPGRLYALESSTNVFAPWISLPDILPAAPPLNVLTVNFSNASSGFVRLGIRR